MHGFANEAHFADNTSLSRHAKARDVAAKVERNDLTKWPIENLLETLAHFYRADGLPQPSTLSGMGPAYPTYDHATVPVRAEIIRRCTAK